MLNRDDNENAFKTNRSNEPKKKKKKLPVQHPFPLINSLAVVLHDYNVVFVRLKRQTS